MSQDLKKMTKSQLIDILDTMKSKDTSIVFNRSRDTKQQLINNIMDNNKIGLVDDEKVSIQKDTATTVNTSVESDIILSVHDVDKILNYMKFKQPSIDVDQWKYKLSFVSDLKNILDVSGDFKMSECFILGRNLLSTYTKYESIISNRTYRQFNGAISKSTFETIEQCVNTESIPLNSLYNRNVLLLISILSTVSISILNSLLSMKIFDKTTVDIFNDAILSMFT